MRQLIPIPEFLKHLPVDERGYVIPYFATYVDGKPDFRLLNISKQETCIKYNKCAVCGKKLIDGVYYFISGPMGFLNQVSTDPAMHKECAEYSLKVCPHLLYQNAERRHTNLPTGTLQDKDVPYMGMDKPPYVMLVKAKKFKTIPAPTNNSKLIKYSAATAEIFKYVDGILQGTGEIITADDIKPKK